MNEYRSECVYVSALMHDIRTVYTYCIFCLKTKSVVLVSEEFSSRWQHDKYLNHHLQLTERLFAMSYVLILPCAQPVISRPTVSLHHTRDTAIICFTVGCCYIKVFFFPFCFSYEYRTEDSSDRDARFKDRIEDADFSALDWKLDGYEIDEDLRKLLYSL